MTIDLTIKLNDDRQTAEVKFGTSDSVTLNASDVAQIFDLFGALRSEMLPEFPETPESLPFGHLGRIGWWVFDTKLNEDRTLMIRHPAFGWIGVGFSDEDADRMAKLITAPMKGPTTTATGTA